MDRVEHGRDALFDPVFCCAEPGPRNSTGWEAGAIGTQPRAAGPQAGMRDGKDARDSHEGSGVKEFKLSVA